jgi:serine/threonine-protein kinase
MGAVFMAEHTVIGKLVAIKVLHARMCESETVVARFFNEARATSAIRHPGIVEVFDFGHDDDGAAYLVMELLDGESLKTRMRRDKPLDWQVATRLAAQIARALDAAHKRGITHRDLKPDNLFLVRDPEVTGGERVKILDFGICKLAPERSNVVTQSGVVIGTPLYMAPEQCRGSGEVDHRADLYSLGCVLYEMVCGRPPFDVPGHGEMLAKHMYAVPDAPSQYAPNMPDNLERIVSKLLAKAPRERYRGANGVATALDAVAAGEPLPVEVDDDPDAEEPAPTPTWKPEPESATTLRGATGETRSIRKGYSTSSKRAPSRTAAIVALGIVAAAAATAVWFVQRDSGDSQSRAGAFDAGIEAAADPAANATDASVENADVPDGRWIRIAPPDKPVLLGLTPVDGDIVAGTVGFHPERRVFAPTHHYDIHAYEVTWAELDPWLAEHPEATVHRPEWVTGSPAARESLPATGVPWQTAYDYCRSVGARLPGEAEWEYAARGPARRPHSWGDDKLDLSRTHVFAGVDAVTVPARAVDQDRTPGGANRAILGLMGNAREWTADLWRENRPNLDESWVQTDDGVFRAVRGLPLAADPPDAMPVEGAAYRHAVCASDVCLRDHEEAVAFVGFRCAREVP